MPWLVSHGLSGSGCALKGRTHERLQERKEGAVMGKLLETYRAKALGTLCAQGYFKKEELRVLRDDPDGEESEVLVSESSSHTYWEDKGWRRAFIEGAVSVLTESEDA